MSEREQPPLSEEQKPPRGAESDNVPRWWFLLHPVVIIFLSFGAIVVVIGLLLPATQRVRNQYTAQTRNNLAQLAVGAHKYGTDHGRLPPGVGFTDGRAGTVLYFLMPTVEAENLYNLGPDAAKTVPVGVYYAPIDDTITDGKTTNGVGAASFAGNVQIFPIRTTNFDPKNPTLSKGIKWNNAFGRQGSSNVVMFATVAGNCTDGFHGHSDVDNPPIFGESYPTFQTPPFFRGVPAALQDGIVIVAMGDRSVRTVTSKVSPATWAVVINPNSPQNPEQDWEGN